MFCFCFEMPQPRYCNFVVERVASIAMTLKSINLLKKKILYFCENQFWKDLRNTFGFSRNLKTTEQGDSFSVQPSRRQEADFVLLQSKSWKMLYSTALHGLVVGAIPFIFDQERTSQKLVSITIIPPILLLIISLLITLFVTFLLIIMFILGSDHLVNHPRLARRGDLVGF